MSHRLVRASAPKTLHSGTVKTPWGILRVARCDQGFRRAAFSQVEAFDRALRSTWPKATITDDPSVAREFFQSALEGPTSLPLAVTGSDFRIGVWQALLEVPRGATITYALLAARVGHPTAIRATASAVAANQLALAIPCHRIIRSDGRTGEFRWGASLKIQLLAAERLG